METMALGIHHDRESWNSALRHFGRHDFGHTYDFHRISENNGEGRLILFTVRDRAGACLVFWPALQRRIVGTEFSDLTSVYGYSGPLVKAGNEAQMANALTLVLDAMRRDRIVSVFSRMHPLISSDWPDSICRPEHIGNVIVIDINRQPRPLESYRSNHRRDIRKAMQAGVTTTVGKSCEDLDAFIEVYYHTMRDLGARDYYFFDRSYLAALLEATEFEATLVSARYQGTTIGAILIIMINGIMHYYLGGVDRRFMRLSPLKLLLAAGHELAIQNDIRHFVLGGGPHGLDDSLIRFKKGFSDLVYPFNVIKKVVDPVAYAELCANAGVSLQDSDFFPAYRAPRS